MADSWSPPPSHFPVEQGYPIPLPPEAPVPLRPPRRKRRGLLLAVAAVAAIATLLLGSMSYSRFADAHSAVAAVTGYFHALASGDAARALGYAAAPPSASAGGYLTDAVLADQLAIAPITEFRVTGSHRSGPDSIIDVRYTLGFATGHVPVHDSVTAVKHGSAWRLDRVARETRIEPIIAGSDRLTFAGRPLPTTPVLLFPGALPISSDTNTVTLSGHPTVRLSAAESVLSVQAELTDAAKKQLADAVEAAFDRCLAATSTDPLCPSVADGRPVPGTLHGQLTKRLADSAPAVDLSGDGNGRVTFKAAATVKGSWKIWDFNNLAQTRSDTTSVTVRASASVDDLSRVYWPGGSGG